MRFQWLAVGVLGVVYGGVVGIRAEQCERPMPAGQLVREVVYNELQDHDRHGYWRYWIESRGEKETRLAEEVETADGLISRLTMSNGRPLDAETQHAEQARLTRLLTSPQERVRHRQDYSEDESRIGMIVALLPDAFLFEYSGEEGGCHRLHFHPNPDYPAHSIETRVMHAMSGDLWVDARLKRIERLEGHFEENVDFGFGMLGRLNKGGWFRLDRTQVGATEWKTDRLEVHISGRAMLLKTIERETSEVRGGFEPVPTGMNLAQGLVLLEHGYLRSPQDSPVTLAMRR